ncbi:ABC transporter permease [Klebsiella pneumoniae]|uniref:ABC transporter permease n=1 Tax=Paenibacillus antri TaxID=2582848 RepID=A0A5R9GC19_9BACL|nr:ABC transporter permease [Paenibacillus antri]TLS52639.1 ABC transporter permease [Paenibacillus antri]TMY87570.1 ABC transporter permease [Klebsiella pneumoniae]
MRSIRNVWPFLAAVASLLALLQLGNWLNPIIFPSLPAVFDRLVGSLNDEKFWQTVGASLYRLFVGYPIACIVAGFLGLVAGLYRGFALYLRRLIAILQSIPPITWLPFLMIIFGFGDVPIILIVMIASFFPMAISVMNGTEGVIRTHLEVAKVLGANKGQLLRKVYLPETFPAFITGAQVAFGNAWRSLVAGEMVGSTMVGLGFSITFTANVADMSGLIMYIIVIGTFATLLDQVLLERLKRRLLRWRYVGGGEER